MPYPRNAGRFAAMPHRQPNRRISLLFDVFVLNQRLRALLNHTLAGTGLRPDEYAVYSVLFEAGRLTPTEMATQLATPLTTVLDYLRTMTERGHLARTPTPRDSRSYQVGLTADGEQAQRRASVAWNAAVGPLEAALEVPIGDVRLALQALDVAAVAAIDNLRDEALRQTG
ncbi:MAG TPA: hypothetical protein VI316_00555 [Candidatus Dormibacteraeota bacterium]